MKDNVKEKDNRNDNRNDNQNNDSKMLEYEVEQYLVHRVIKAGGLCFKFVSPGNIGVPDRIIIYNGRVLFVETKRPGEKMRKSQLYRKAQFRRHGSDIAVIDTKKGVDEFVDNVLIAGKGDRREEEPEEKPGEEGGDANEVHAA